MENTSTRRQLLAGLAASTIAAGSTAGASVDPMTPETGEALRAYWTCHAHYCSKEVHGEEVESAAFDKLMQAETALLTSPTNTPEDIAAKLDYALKEGLCGDQMTSDMTGLDNAMFRDMIAALRGPITDAIKVGG